MQMYKLITLGQSFVFINDGIYSDKTLHGAGGKNKEALLNEGTIVYVSTDMRYDYRIYRDANNSIFKPDFERAVMLFLYYAKGLPRSEYDIFYENEKAIMRLPQFDSLCGGNVGKCKLMYSKSTLKTPCEFYLVETNQGNYIILVCDNPKCGELSKISSRILLESSPPPVLRGVVSLSFCENEAYIETKNFDGSDLRDTSVFAAACCVCEKIFHVSGVTVHSGELMAFCESSVSGVSVFDTSPKVYKMV